jgi:cell division protein FtsI (penicillin-binding protein 3)
MKKKVVSSLISFFPINNPRYALFVLVDEPKATGNIRGRTPGFNAVPLTKEIIMEIAPLLGQKSINKTEL